MSTFENQIDLPPFAISMKHSVLRILLQILNERHRYDNLKRLSAKMKRGSWGL